jgi:hypothetical protein
MALPFEKQPNESEKAFGAFAMYLSLGPERSLAAVARKAGKGKRQMEKWSGRWEWPARVAAYGAHLAELERGAIERVAKEKAVEWWKMHEPTRRQAWLEAEEAIAMVRKARERWEKSGRTPGFEGMARMLELAFKLKQFAAGMPSEIKETHTHVTGKVSVEWEAAIRKAYGVVDVEEVQRSEVGDQRTEVGEQRTEVGVQNEAQRRLTSVATEVKV